MQRQVESPSLSALATAGATSALAAALLLCGCPAKPSGDGGGAGGEAPADPGMAAEVEAFYAAQPDFFVRATPGDLPAGLVWEDGADNPEMGSPEAVKGGTFRFFTQDFPRTLRFVGPDASGSFRRWILDYNIMLLVRPHPDLPDGYYPALAKAWAVGEDGKTVYFKLDPEARYSDGKPVRAEDYFFTFFFMRSPHINAPWYNDYYTNKFTNITIYDEATISLTFVAAKPDVVYWTGSFRPVPQHFYTTLAEDYRERYDWAMEPTTGAYMVHDKDIKKGKSIALRKVEDWWAKDKRFYRYRYNPDKLHFTVIRDVNKQVEAFRKGELDYYPLNLGKHWYDNLPDDAPEVAQGYIEKVTFYNQIPRPTWGLNINCHQPLLDNRDIRAGLHHAANFQLVIDQVFRGDYARLQSVADGYGVFSNPAVKARPFSIEQAESHFAKAGFTERDADGYLVNGSGQRLEFTLTTGYKRMEDAMNILVEQAKRAGVKLNFEMLELTAAWKKANEKKHDITFSGLNVSVELYPRFWESYHSDNAYKEDGSVRTNTNNRSMTADPEIDGLIDRYRASGDYDEILQLSHQLIQKLHEHGGYIPAFYRPWYRLGHWRWMRFPEGFNVMKSRDEEEFHLFWIDEAMREETLEAKKAGRGFPPVVKVYDQYKQD